MKSFLSIIPVASIQARDKYPSQSLGGPIIINEPEELKDCCPYCGGTSFVLPDEYWKKKNKEETINAVYSIGSALIQGMTGRKLPNGGFNSSPDYYICTTCEKRVNPSRVKR